MHTNLPPVNLDMEQNRALSCLVGVNIGELALTMSVWFLCHLANK